MLARYLLVFALCQTAALGANEPIEKILKELDALAPGIETHVVTKRCEAIERIHQCGRGNAATAIPRLLALVRQDPAWPVWQDALQAACAVAATDDVPKIVAAVRSQIEALAVADASDDHLLRGRIISRTTTLCAFFLQQCIPLLPDRGAQSAELLQLLTDMEVPAERGWIIGGDPLEVALSLLPSEEARSEHVLQYIARAGQDGEHDHSWGSLASLRANVNARVREGLYRAVLDSVERGPYLNRLAAGALAEWGDARLLPILRRPPDDADVHSTAKRIWQVEVQNPPRSLLEVIMGPDSVHTERAWAARRAIDHGLPEDQIIQAIQTYCRKSEDSSSWRGQSTVLKSEAVRLGLLNATDIPSIPYFDQAGTSKEDSNRRKATIDWIESGACSKGP